MPQLERASPIAAYRGWIPLGPPLSPTYADGIIVVGSAAGQVYALSGHKLKYSMRCGELAGKVAVDAVSEGDVSGEGLEEYEHRWRAEFGAELEAGQLLRSALAISQDRRMDGLLELLGSKPKPQRAFANLFRPADVERSCRVLFSDEEVARLLGRESADKVLAL